MNILPVFAASSDVSLRLDGTHGGPSAIDPVSSPQAAQSDGHTRDDAYNAWQQVNRRHEGDALARTLRHLRAAVAHSGVTPASIDDVGRVLEQQSQPAIQGCPNHAARFLTGVIGLAAHTCSGITIAGASAEIQGMRIGAPAAAGHASTAYLADAVKRMVAPMPLRSTLAHAIMRAHGLDPDDVVYCGTALGMSMSRLELLVPKAVIEVRRAAPGHPRSTGTRYGVQPADHRHLRAEGACVVRAGSGGSASAYLVHRSTQAGIAVVPVSADVQNLPDDLFAHFHALFPDAPTDWPGLSGRAGVMGARAGLYAMNVAATEAEVWYSGGEPLAWQAAARVFQQTREPAAMGE